jgi:L-ascorbate metabolism protein UlaG (beta-lactamase superfamily)
MKKVIKMIFTILFSLIALFAIGVAIFLYTSPEFGASSKGESAEKIAKSSNFKDGKFNNAEATEVSTGFKWGTIPEFFRKGDKVPDWSLPVDKMSVEEVAATPDSVTKLTWFGHSALLLEIDGKKIFLDPMLGKVPSPVSFLGEPRFNDTLPLSIESIPDLDAVLISHDHYDHLDYGSIVKLKDRVAKFYVPLGIKAHLVSWGVSEAKIVEMDWWEETELEGIKFISTPARHFSGRGLLDRATTLWCSWVILGKQEKIYFGGDSGYGTHFKEIGNKFGPFDFAMLECGQYNEQWANIHMMPEQTVQASVDLQADLMMPIHWGSFKLALHKWSEPAERASAEAKRLNVRMATPKIGESIILGDQAPQTEWWKR